MAQFQILMQCSAAEWRPVTVEYRYAPEGDQQFLWPSFEEADAARKKLLVRACDVELRVALAGSDVSDVDWQTREKLRFADRTYAPTPWHDEYWYQAKHDEHFCHVSVEQAGKIAFTENAARGQLDRQLVMSPGRYLNRYFSNHLDNDAIEGWCAKLSVQLQEDALKITQDAEEIEDVYVGGPSSCMAHETDEFESFCHPTRAYAGPDTALAYIGTRDDARARSIVWPERKIYTSLYGDVSRLKLLLENAGYTVGSLNGARIRRIEDGESFVVPYIDAGGDLADDGEYLLIGRGSISSESTSGLAHDAWYCPRCDEDSQSHGTVHFANGSSEEWCYGCYSNLAVHCDHNDRRYSDVETFVTVYSDRDEHNVLEEDAEHFGAIYLEQRGEWWRRDACRQCDASREWFLADDLTEYHGEWLSEGYLPEPFDDDDPALVNAHVQAYCSFHVEMAAILAEAARWQAASERVRQEGLKREQQAAESFGLEAIERILPLQSDDSTGCGDSSPAPWAGETPDQPVAIVPAAEAAIPPHAGA